MFKVTFGDLRRETFNGAVTTIINHRGYKDPRIAYNIAKISRRLETEQKEFRKLYVDFMKRWTVLDEDGDIAAPKGPGTFELKDEYKKEPGYSEYKAAVDEFNAVEVKVDCHKIPFIVVQELLSPIEITAVEMMLDMSALESSPAGKVTPLKKPLKKHGRR